MQGLLVSWLVLSLVVLATAKLLPGVRVSRFVDALVVAALLGVLNVLIGWFLFAIIGLATLGLGFVLAFVTRWVVNAILLKLVDKLTTRLTIVGWANAFLAALIMSGLGTLAEILLVGAIGR